MKKYSIFIFVMVITFGMNFSSCRSCKGGGWYGDRNLGYTPEKKTQEDGLKVIIKPEEEACSFTAP
jgi:hypothetical protein